MSGHRKWSEVRKGRPSTPEDLERRARARQELEEEIAQHTRSLKQLRRAKRMTQSQLGMLMNVSQAQVSRVENQADLYLSTLRSYIQAMGGELQLRVSFPDEDWCEVTIDEVTDLNDVPAAADFEALQPSEVIESSGWGVVSASPSSFTASAVQWPDSYHYSWPGHATWTPGTVSLWTGPLISPTSPAMFVVVNQSTRAPSEPTPREEEGLQWVATNGELHVPSDHQGFIASAEYREA